MTHVSYAHPSRRQFVKTGAAVALAAVTPYTFTSRARAQQSKNDRPIFGAIGLGGQGTRDAERAKQNGADMVAVCDVNRANAEKAQGRLFQQAEIYEDYRKLLDRKDIEAVTIGTPDHWHTPIALAALEAGKHVYCEKPLTLTIDEGKLLVAAVAKSGKKFQVGTQQRTDQWQLFGRAVATVQSGQLGKLKSITVHLPAKSTLEGGPFPALPVPAGLNWDFWQGQAAAADYCLERLKNFRWFYEYSGGIMTDWGAHHMDIAQWALGVDHHGGPLTIDGSQTKMPSIPGGYNTPKHPIVRYTYAHDVELNVVAEFEGVTFEGDKGRIFVNRGRITGTPIEEQDANPKLKEETLDVVKKMFGQNVDSLGDHMKNFFEAFKHDLPTASDVTTGHRTATACHLGGISMRLGRKIQWDASKEEIVGDNEANAMLKREQRAGYKFG